MDENCLLCLQQSVDDRLLQGVGGDGGTGDTVHVVDGAYEYVDPAGFFTASYRPTTLLLPAIQYSGHALAIPLDWVGGAVLGFVTAPNTEPKVLAYAEYIRSHLQPIQNFWTPLD